MHFLLQHAAGFSAGLLILVFFVLRLNLPGLFIYFWCGALSLFSAVLAGIFHHFFYPSSTVLFILLAALLNIFFFILVICFRFFRDPEREISADDSIICSPADGTIRYVREIDNGNIPICEKKGTVIPVSDFAKTSLIKDGAYLIGIEMSVLDVHVNRSPVKGKIISQTHHAGSFHSLRDIAALLENERMTTIISGDDLEIGVIQIASRLVRKIISFVKPGENIQKGSRFGMIRFGSQVDVVLPKNRKMNILVQTGQHVKAGESALAVLER